MAGCAALEATRRAGVLMAVNPLLDDLAAVTTANEAALPEALLRAWRQTVPADYHSMMRRTEASGVIEIWWPGEGLLTSGHWLVRLFAQLWAAEDPAGTHPSVIAFLRQGPGAYLRSALEDEATWQKRAHYQIVDKQHGIRDMVSVFIVTRPGTLVVFHAGSREANFDPAILEPAGQFGRVVQPLIMMRGGFVAQGGNRVALLTPRERQILRIVAAGKRNTEIATELGISPLTVRKHLENLFAKLSVDNRTAAAAMFRQAEE